MQVRVGPTSIDVLEQDVFTALAVITALPTEEAVAHLLVDGLARPGAEVGHVWLDVAELARRADPGRDEHWRAGFDGMIAYASSRGWADADGGLVRAHVEVGQ